MNLSDKKLHNSVVSFHFIYEDKKYPRGSVVFGVGGDEHFTPSTAIIDPRTGMELAYLEVRDDADEDKRRSLAQSYADLHRRKEISLPVYLMSTSEVIDAELKVFALSSEGQWVAIRNDEFPSFEVLSSRRILEHDEDSKKKVLSTTSELKRVSQGITLSLCILLVLDFCGQISITQNHLLLLLGIAVILVLPYFNIIKILGLELELQRNKQQDDKKDKT